MQHIAKNRLDRLIGNSVISTALRMILCLFFASCRQGGAALPLALSLTAATSVKLLILAAVFSITGYLAVPGMPGVRYAAAVAVLTGVQLIFHYSKDSSAVWWFCLALAATVTLSTGFALVVSGDGGSWFLVETAGAGIAAVCFSMAKDALTAVSGKSPPGFAGFASLAASVCALSLPFFGLQGAIGAVGAALILFPLCRGGAALPLPKGPPAKIKFPPRTAQVAEVLRELTAQLQARVDGPISTEVLSHAVDCVCRTCKQNHRCWGANYNTMMDCLTEMAMLLRRRCDLAECDLPKPFDLACVKRAQFVAAATAEARRFEATHRLRQDGLGEIGVLRNQCLCFSAVLDDLEAHGADSSVSDANFSRRLLEHLPQGSTFTAEYVRHGKLQLSGFCPGGPFKLKKLCQAIAFLSERRLTAPEVSRTDGGFNFTVNETAGLAVSTKRHISLCPESDLPATPCGIFALTTENMSLFCQTAWAQAVRPPARAAWPQAVLKSSCKPALAVRALLGCSIRHC